eukprot:scaffold34574_cov19-Tisochrysis_lutea.AAC.1
MQSKRVEEMMRAHEDDAVQTGDKAMVVMGFMRMMQCKQAVVMMSAHGGDASGRCMKHKARLEGETRERLSNGQAAEAHDGKQARMYNLAGVQDDEGGKMYRLAYEVPEKVKSGLFALARKH